MRLAPNFRLDEFEYSTTANNNSIHNKLPDQLLNNMTVVANLLQEIRNHYNTSVTITSGYRCPELNKLIGGASHSDHMWGKAADFIIPGIPCEAVFNEMKWTLDPNTFRLMILEYRGPAEWIHISAPCLRRPNGKLLKYRDGNYSKA